MDTYTEKFTVQLSEEEKQKIAEELTQHEISLAEVKADKVNEMKSFNESIKDKETQILALSKEYQEGTKAIEVECYFVFDEPEAGQKTIYRSDTGSKVRVTDMNMFDNPNSHSNKINGN